MTALDPGPNVFRFTLGYAQGEGRARRVRLQPARLAAGGDGIARRRARLGVGPLDPMAEFCSLGGDVVDRIWLDEAPEKMPARLATIPRKGG